MTDERHPIDLSIYLVTEQTPHALDILEQNRSPATLSMIEDLMELDKVDGSLPTALGTWGRASDAYACTRRSTLRKLDAPEDFPMSGASKLTLKIGDTAHAFIQTAWHIWFHYDEPCTGARDCPHSAITVEADADLRPLGHDVSAHVDMWNTEDNLPFEIKSASQYGYQRATGRGFRPPKGAPFGPEMGHAVQACFSAMAKGADEFQIIYVNKGKHDEFAEWVIPTDVVRPFAERELAVMGRTRAIVDEGLLPPRWSAEFGMIDDPGLHKSVTGKWPKPAFFCGGCQWNTTCRNLPTGEVPLATVGLEPPQEAAS